MDDRDSMALGILLVLIHSNDKTTMHADYDSMAKNWAHIAYTVADAMIARREPQPPRVPRG